MTAPAAMQADFASRTMLQIISAGLDLLTLPASIPLGRATHERIPLASKQALLQQIHRDYGLPALLRVGAGVKQLANSPIGIALLQGSTPETLLGKWQRLEKYVHSRHYTRCELSHQQAWISHHARSGPPPSLEEDLLILGVLCALLHQLGLREIRLSTSGQADQAVYVYPAQTVNASALVASANWYLHWTTGCIQPEAADARPAQAQSVIERTKAIMRQLGLLNLTLGQVAQAQGLSSRSLQRQLQHSGADFSSLLQSVRVQAASELLLASTTISTAEIGFVCGFADQAHFSRLFKQWAGMTPGEFRQFKTPSATGQH
ncbi:response regulator transcription factor [Chitinibacter sp. GC72]|uniref:helix-turn-helix transcriptional regulator n=1 Tax=Chitinibacter sp. GC72 TaxID=1526917 RepID=UPI0012FCB0B5|nr:response regulator transcription factor [Chitinibacter sp. GC72]